MRSDSECDTQLGKWKRFKLTRKKIWKLWLWTRGGYRPLELLFVLLFSIEEYCVVWYAYILWNLLTMLRASTSFCYNSFFSFALVFGHAGSKRCRCYCCFWCLSPDASFFFNFSTLSFVKKKHGFFRSWDGKNIESAQSNWKPNSRQTASHRFILGEWYRRTKHSSSRMMKQISPRYVEATCRNVRRTSAIHFNSFDYSILFCFISCTWTFFFLSSHAQVAKHANHKHSWMKHAAHTGQG